MPHTYDHARPALTVDAVVFSAEHDELSVLLVRRDQPPFEGRWATPGGFVDVGDDEPIIDAAYRELAEETGLLSVELTEYATFGRPGRDPRGRVVSVAHWGLCRAADHDIQPASDAADYGWFPAEQLPGMAFDHEEVVGGALTALRRRARTGPIGRDLLEPPFKLRTLFNLYRSVLDRSIDGERFRRFVLDEAAFVERDSEGCRFREDRYETLIDEPYAPFIDA
jgi:8-oxo-dGTP diphosphatase